MYTLDEKKLRETNNKVETLLKKHQIGNHSDISGNNVNQKHPIPIDKEINLDPSKTIMSKTDARGIIEYANSYFMEISGYEEYELMGQPHNIIRHPDMPQVIFKLLWERINKGENIHAFVKNLAKDGRYYWVLTNFETKFDENGAIVSHYARRKAAPRSAVYEIEKLYKTLRAIELRQDMKTAENYFKGLLEEKQMTYDDFILNLLNIDKQVMATYFDVPNTEKQRNSKKRGIIGRLFS